MGQRLVIILELDLEHGIRQRLCNDGHYLNRIFLRQTASRFRQRACCASGMLGRACYSVKTLAPVAVTATECSK
jgi:hypothetical protein